MPEPLAIAVVVATRGRPDRLRRLLLALADQGADEVVVVHDDDDDATAAALRRELPPGLPLRIERQAAPSGPAAKRNTGWRATRSPLVAFTDDDCEPAPGWLDVLRSAGGDLVQGRVEPHPGERHRLGPLARTQRVEQAGPWYQTANIRYPRALLERLGGFDERYPVPAAEDTDLAWRALEARAEVTWAPDAVVWHAVEELSLREHLRLAGRWSNGVRVVRRHPGLRAHVHHRVFWKMTHERLLLAALGVGLARRTRGGSLPAAIPYLRLRRGPRLAAIDAAEVLAMVRGSLRARTLLL